MRMPRSGPALALLVTLAGAAVAFALYWLAVEQWNVYETGVMAWLFTAGYVIAVVVYGGLQVGRGQLAWLARPGVASEIALVFGIAAVALLFAWESIEARMPDIGIFDGSILMVPLYAVEVTLSGVALGALMSDAHEAARSRGKE